MRTTLFLSFAFVTLNLAAQDGYKIDFKIKGLKDTTAYLGFYLQENTFVKDTARVNASGSFTFRGSQPLPQGIYIIILGNSILSDLLVGPNQRFAMETVAPEYVKNMVVKGDDDNRIFFENRLFEIERDNEAKPFATILKDSIATEEQKKNAREQLMKITETVMTNRQSIIEKYPETVVARLMKASTPIRIPEPPKKPDGTIDSTFQLRYYREHYFDNFNLADGAMLRMPKVSYWEKVKDYLSRLFVQHPDSITKAIDGLVSVAKRSQDTYKYLVWNCIVHYQQPEIMGLDEVYVNLVDKYIATGEMDYWLDKKTVHNLKDYADKVRRAMIGSTAPNLIMQNENLQPKALYDLKNKYVILYFFKPTCGACREETPKLIDFFNANKNKLNLGAFAVSTDTSMKEMKEFIRDFKTPWTTVNGPRSYIKTHFSQLYFSETTPTIYILDDRKKVIARKLGVEQLPGFFENYERMAKRKGYTISRP